VLLTHTTELRAHSPLLVVARPLRHALRRLGSMCVHVCTMCVIARARRVAPPVAVIKMTSAADSTTTTSTHATHDDAQCVLVCCM
jgi:hypothetical protein